MLLLIDNYDSFTYNLVHFLGDLGARCIVRRNDEITVDEAMALEPDGIVLSPGPCTPNEAGICLDLVAASAKAQMPLLGVCLGHQAIGQMFGGKVVRAPTPMHGKLERHRAQEQQRVRGCALALPGHPLPFSGRRARGACPTHSRSPPRPATSSWGCATRRCRSTACSSIPRASPREHGHKILENFLKIAGEHPSQQKKNAA